MTTTNAQVTPGGLLAQLLAVLAGVAGYADPGNTLPHSSQPWIVALSAALFAVLQAIAAYHQVGIAKASAATPTAPATTATSSTPTASG